MSKPDKLSKYAAKNRKFIYSPQYHAWKAAALKFGACDREAIRLGCLHAKTFRVYREECQ